MGASDGIARAEDHAEDASPGWVDRAILHMRVFIAEELWKTSGSRLFLIEQARGHAYKAGLESPPDNRAWGAVARKAERDKVIEPYSVAPATSSNGSRKVLWRALP